MSEARNFFLLVGVFVAAPLVAGLGINLLKKIKDDMPEKKDTSLRPQWTPVFENNKGVAWQYDRFTADGALYSTKYFVGNADHTRFTTDSRLPKGHSKVNGQWAANFTKQGAIDYLAENDTRPALPEKNKPNPSPFPTGSKELSETMNSSAMRGGWGSSDSKPRFNF